MTRKVTLTITSLLSMLFMAFHLTDDIVRGIEPGGISTLVGVLILVVWLYATLVLADRRSGYFILLRGSILGSAVPVVHMMGGGTCRRQDRQLQRSLFLGLDAHRARRDRELLRHPLGARTVEPAAGPVPVVQLREYGKTNTPHDVWSNVVTFLQNVTAI